MTSEEFQAWTAGNERARLLEQCEAFRKALLDIAALSDGPVVYGGFDEPASAARAREALAGDWIGPCVHGRDPWDRCDKCERAGQVVAWAMAEIAKGGA